MPIPSTAVPAFLAALACAAFGQPATAPLAFEVASVRQHDGPLMHILNYSPSGARLTLGTYPPVGLIGEAYNLEFYQIVFPPSLSRDDLYYDIVAKAPGDSTPTRADFRRMLQTLLAERFHFAFHREPREMPVYALIVAKGGPKFKPSVPDAKPHFLGGVNGRNQFIQATRYTMAELARELHSFLGADRPVLDQTGLSGEYDFRIEATPRRNLEFGDISVFTAVQDQLGLKLEPRKAPVEVLVVDRFDKPSAN